MKGNVIGLIWALAIGGAAGFLVGKKATTGATAETLGEARSARRVNVTEPGPAEAVASATSAARPGSSRGLRVDSAEEAMALPGQNNRLQALMNYYAGLSPDEFKEEADKLEELPWSERIMVGYLLFARWGEEDPTAAMAYTKTMGFTGMFVKKTVIQSWASKFPQEAANYYTSNASEFRMSGMMGRGRGGGSAASVIAMEWARQDSAGAMAWAKTLEGSDQSDAMQGIFRMAASEDPASAAQLLASIADEDARVSAQNTIAREWGGKDWRATQAWIAGLPSDQQEAATARALRGLADADPAAAAAEISALSGGSDLSDTMQSIARKWGREDPDAAAAWVMQNGNEDARADSIGSVVSSWVARDPAAALEFVHQQPEGALRDRAASSYVISNQGGDIQQNLRIAESIANEDLRRRAIGITATAWMRQDKAGAGEYIDTTQALSDESRARIKRFAEAGGH